MTNEQQTVERLAQNIRPEQEQQILGSTEKKLRQKGILRAGATLLWNVRLLYRMVKDNTYKLDLSTKALILGALVYFILPTDATPDFIPMIGYIDDSLVITWVVKRLSNEIDRYRQHLGV